MASGKPPPACDSEHGNPSISFLVVSFAGQFAVIPLASLAADRTVLSGRMRTGGWTRTSVPGLWSVQGNIWHGMDMWHECKLRDLDHFRPVGLLFLIWGRKSFDRPCTRQVMKAQRFWSPSVPISLRSNSGSTFLWGVLVRSGERGFYFRCWADWKPQERTYIVPPNIAHSIWQMSIGIVDDDSWGYNSI